jgi:GT2 family glycosyltransferase
MDNGNIVPENTTFSIPHVTIMKPGRNIGVAGAWNEFLKRFWEVDYIVISNDDATLYADTIEILLEHKKQGHAFVYPGGVNKEGNTMNAFSLFMVEPSIVSLVGWFDKNLKRAYFEDNDYAYRLHLLGHKLFAAPCTYSHIGSATAKALSSMEAKLEHHMTYRWNERYYHAKWGGPPHEEKFTVPFNGEEEEAVLKRLGEL